MITKDAGSIEKGMYIMFRGAPHQVTKKEFMNPGKGSAIMRVRFRNVETGVVLDFTYKTSETIEIADVDKKPMQFLYRDGDNLVFMDPVTYDQVNVPVSLVEDQVGFLIPNLDCFVLWYEDKAIGVILPPHVNLKIVESPDAVAGNRVNAPKKTAKVETGIEVQVPLFIKEGETIIVDTTSGEYLSRAN